MEKPSTSPSIGVLCSYKLSRTSSSRNQPSSKARGETDMYGSLRVLGLHGMLDFDYVKEISKVPKKHYQAINLKRKGVNVKTTPFLTQPL